MSSFFRLLEPTGKLVFALAVALSLFQIWQPLVGFIPPGILPLEQILGLQPATYFRPIHLTWILVIGYLVFPLTGHLRWLDAFTIVAVLWSGFRILSFDYQGLDHLLNGLALADFTAGLIVIVATLELARRSVGLVMMLVGLVFVLYGAFGNFLPDVHQGLKYCLDHPSRSMSDIV